MMSQKIFDLLNYLGKNLRNNSRPFGGIQVVFCGDFFQLGPIGDPEDPESGMFCFESPDWFSIFPKTNHIELKTMFRQTDPRYIHILSEVRQGELSPESIQTLQTYVKREYDPEANNGCVLTKLFPVKNRAEYINKLMFDKLEHPGETFNMIIHTNCTLYLDSGKPIESLVLDKCDQLTLLEREHELEQLITNNNMPKTLDLKIGSAVMCTANLDLEKGICNGTQGVIVDIIGTGDYKQPKIKFANGVVFLMPIHFIQSEEYPSLAIGQIPLILAWALTIHKIQGATLAMGQMDIGQTIFEYGQTYVALSRIQSLEGLYLSSFEPGKIRANPKVKQFYQNI
jgi:ATP-dependent DNA helicase PIF1